MRFGIGALEAFKSVSFFYRSWIGFVSRNQENQEGVGSCIHTFNCLFAAVYKAVRRNASGTVPIFGREFFHRLLTASPYSATLRLGYYDGEHPWDNSDQIKKLSLQTVHGYLFNDAGGLEQEFESHFNLETGSFDHGWQRDEQGEVIDA